MTDQEKAEHEATCVSILQHEMVYRLLIIAFNAGATLQYYTRVNGFRSVEMRWEDVPRDHMVTVPKEKFIEAIKEGRVRIKP